MSKVTLTVQQIINLGLWDRVCEYKGWREDICRDGTVKRDELVDFDDEFRKETLQEEPVLDKVSIMVEVHFNKILSSGQRRYVENKIVDKFFNEWNYGNLDPYDIESIDCKTEVIDDKK